MKVAVVGAGLMGAQIGAEHALGGHDVALVASTAASCASALERALAAIAALERESLADASAAAAARSRLRAEPDLGAACDGAEVIVESLPEDLAVKARVLRAALDRAPRDAIVATNTSSLSVSAIGDAAGAPERTVGAHYANPAIFMPLVEVVPGRRTRAEVVSRISGVLRGNDKQPIVVRDVPGFLWNRLQFAVLREAARIVDERIASAEDVDLAMRRVLGRRWSVIGPFETMALGGARTFATIAAQLFPEVEPHVDPDVLTRVPLPPAGDDAKARRDAALARLLRDERTPAPRDGP